MMISAPSTVLCLACLAFAPWLRAQAPSIEVRATVEIAPTPTICTIAPESTLDFAVIEGPANPTQAGTVTLSPQTTALLRPSGNLTTRGAASAGSATVSGVHISAFQVEIAPAFESAKLRGEGAPLSFAGLWAQSAHAEGPYDEIAGPTYIGTISTSAAVLTRHFRFGGTLRNVTARHYGVYETAFILTVTCI